MSVPKPSLPRGTRDFGPAEMARREYIISVLKENFRLFGFAPIETPAMEQLSTLTGKYGEEGDQLIYKILNSRLHENRDKPALREAFEQALDAPRNSPLLTEKALRYDLTVPFARYVVMNRHKLTFPFRRSQVQPVWRADKPQRGRYREFYQCDADVIGSDSLMNEIDLLTLMDRCFWKLNLPAVIRVNNRKILTALAAVLNEPDRVVDITVAIDKFDKVGPEGVAKELADKGIQPAAIERLMPLITATGGHAEKTKAIRRLVGDNPIGKKGLEELEFVFRHSDVNFCTIELDLSLARGLNYYTGTIFEVRANVGTFTPSIVGGGRYDDLTGIFGLEGLSGVGISFGIDRIYDVLDEMQLFPPEVSAGATTMLLFTHFDLTTHMHAIYLATVFRDSGVSCEVFPETGKKLGKQFEYANKKTIPYVCTVGEDEIERSMYKVKNMQTGEQFDYSVEDMLKQLFGR